MSYSFKMCSEADYSEYINKQVQESGIEEENVQQVLAFATYRLQVTRCILKETRQDAVSAWLGPAYAGPKARR